MDVKNAHGIHCRDVFEAVHDTFNEQLTPVEWKLILDRRGVEDAFRLRCNLSPSLPEVEHSLGWKRVDVLLHKMIFLGLTQFGGDWVLNLGSLRHIPGVSPSPHKDPVLDRVRAGKVPITKDADSLAARHPAHPNKLEPQPSDSVQAHNHPLPANPRNSPSYSPQRHPQARGPLPDRVSPPYHTPQLEGSSSESATTGDYVSL